MSGTAPKPTKEALLNDELNPLKGASSGSESVSGSATEAVLLSRLVGVEVKADNTANLVSGLSNKIDQLLTIFSSTEPPTEPPVTTAAASSGAPVPDPDGFVIGSDLPRHSAAAKLSDGSASLTNGNMATHLPAIDAQTKAFMAGGVDIPASSKGVLRGTSACSA